MSIDLGGLGKIEIIKLDTTVLDVYAKNMDSVVNPTTGPNFSDDCVLNPPLCGGGPAITY